MRPWVLLAESGIPFEERDGSVRRSRLAGAGRLALGAGAACSIADELRIWDSLAIAEYLHEQFPEKQLWPADAAARATARSASCEMHSGFADLRRECSMNLGARFDKEVSAKCAADVRRVDALFADCRAPLWHGRRASLRKVLHRRRDVRPGRLARAHLRQKLSEVSQRYADALLALPVRAALGCRGARGGRRRHRRTGLARRAVHPRGGRASRAALDRSLERAIGSTIRSRSAPRIWSRIGLDRDEPASGSDRVRDLVRSLRLAHLGNGRSKSSRAAPGTATSTSASRSTVSRATERREGRRRAELLSFDSSGEVAQIQLWPIRGCAISALAVVEEYVNQNARRSAKQASGDKLDQPQRSSRARMDALVAALPAPPVDERVCVI